jgi:diadenosine tetraphosphatase ApaH/serine/threonine PP2A family protein phosphatase
MAQSSIVRYFLRRFSPLLRLYPEEIPMVGSRIAIPRFTADEIIGLFARAEEALVADCTPVLDLPVPAWVIGDLHGNFHDLLRILTTISSYPECPVICLGDYVDRGSYSIEILLLLWTLKCAHPESYYFIRGNHEFPKLNEQYGFKEECDSRYPDSNIWQRANDLFTYLPLAIVLGGSVVCLHGGLGPDCKSVQTIRKICLPLDESCPSGVVSQIVWSDPVDQAPGFIASPRGCGYGFGPYPLGEFLRASQCKRMLRAHECVMHGLAPFGNDLGLTVFSSSNYTGRGNLAGFAEVGKEGDIKAHQLQPLTNLADRADAEFEDGAPFEDGRPLEKVNRLNRLASPSMPQFKFQSYPMSKLAMAKPSLRASGLFKGPDVNQGRLASLRRISGP